MEMNKAKLNTEFDFNYSHQKTTRKNSKVNTSQKTTINVRFVLVFGIILSAAIIVYFLSGFERKNNTAQSTQNESTHKENANNSPTYKIDQIVIGGSGTYNSTSGGSIINNNPQQSISQAQAVRQVTPKVKEQSPKVREMPRQTQNQPSPSYSTSPKSASVNQNQPRSQARVVDFELSNYLRTMKELGLQGRETADEEDVSTTCLSKQNDWYLQTASFLREFQDYLQANYDANYFLLQDSYIERLASDIPYNDAQCRRIFGSQASIIVTLSNTIRTRLKDNLPNS